MGTMVFAAAYGHMSKLNIATLICQNVPKRNKMEETCTNSSLDFYFCINYVEEHITLTSIHTIFV